MGKIRILTGIGMLVGAALLAAGPAFADEFARASEPFVQGVEINHPGYRAHYTGRETFTNVQGQGDESGVRTALYDGMSLNLAHAFAPRQLTLQRPWSDAEQALGVSQ